MNCRRTLLTEFPPIFLSGLQSLIELAISGGREVVAGASEYARLLAPVLIVMNGGFFVSPIDRDRAVARFGFGAVFY